MFPIRFKTINKSNNKRTLKWNCTYVLFASIENLIFYRDWFKCDYKHFKHNQYNHSSLQLKSQESCFKSVLTMYPVSVLRTFATLIVLMISSTGFFIELTLEHSRQPAPPPTYPMLYTSFSMYRTWIKIGPWPGKTIKSGISPIIVSVSVLRTFATLIVLDVLWIISRTFKTTTHTHKPVLTLCCTLLFSI